ncbi:MAG TPA: efflux RND transporter periplasmic adaptor subunit [Spirochaetia bacterium]|nr:efflux RND transporter periplasmic adaptor subunit [Spirochaetia bacterium]
MKTTWAVPLVAVGLLLGSCGATGTPSGGDPQSMDQIHAATGVPVRVQTITRQPFAAHLSFPALFRARSQTVAYAKVSDVVREVRAKIGDHVERGQIVVSLSMDNSAYQQAKLSFESAEAAFNRTKSLFAQAGISRQDFDNTQSGYEHAKEAFKSASETIEVTAPIDGYITQLNVQSSSNVKPGDALFTVSNQDGYEATFSVTADEIDSIRTGARAVIAGRNETIEGQVTEVSLNMDPDTKAFLVRAFFAGKPRTLVSGMNVDLQVETYRNDRAIVVAQKDLVHGGGGWTAYVVQGNRAVRRDLVTGRQQGLDLEVVKGLAEGELLVTDGVEGLADGTLVKVVDSARASGGN